MPSLWKIRWNKKVQKNRPLVLNIHVAVCHSVPLWLNWIELLTTDQATKGSNPLRGTIKQALLAQSDRAPGFGPDC